jgi:hypothetical protein
MQELVCPECEGGNIGFTEDMDESVRRLGERMRVDRQKAPKRYRRMHRRIMGSAELYQKYGFPAVFVLAGRGIWVSDADGILNREKVISEKLIDMVLEGEKKAMKRRYFT